MAQNLFDAGLSQQGSSAAPPDSPEVATPQSTAPTGNLFDAGAGLTSSAPTQSAAPPSTSGNLFDAGAGISTPSAGVKEVEDSSAPWYKKVWDFANKPLLDIDDALGRTGKAGGFEKGVNDLVSGLTSPLSIALTVGTLGAGGLAESAGASVLKTVGIEGAEAISNITKGARILAEAEKAGKGAEEGFAAAKAAGVNVDQLVEGMSALRQANLGKDSLLTNGLIRRGGGAVLRKFGVGAAKADNVAQGIQTLVNAGFTVQNAYSAVENSPKVLDALKEGDYETAKRLAIDALGSGALAVVGAHEFAKESVGVRDAIQDKVGLKVKPSEENQVLRKTWGEREASVAEAGQSNKNWEEGLRKQYKNMDPTDLERTKYYIESGMDADTMARRYNALAENAGRPDRVPVPDSDPSVSLTSGMTPERVQNVIEDHALAKADPKYVDKLLDAYDPRKITPETEELAKTVTEKHNDTMVDPRNKDVIPEAVDDYSTNMWKKEDKDNAIANTISHDVRSGNFPTSTSMARARVFDTAFEGQMLGKQLEVTDPIALAANNSNTFSRIAANRDFISKLQDRNIRASDGRPLAILSGNASTLNGEEHNSIMINPDKVRNLRIPAEQLDKLKQSGDLDRMMKKGQIVDLTRKITPDNIQKNIDMLEDRAVAAPPQFDEQGNVVLRKQIDLLKDIRDGKEPESRLGEINAHQPPVYAWNHGDYRTIDHPALKDWKHVASGKGGDNVFVKSDVVAHPEAAEYLKRLLGVDDKGVGAGPLGSFSQKINREGKGLLLFGSPFHILQEGLRGLMTGVSPFGFEHIDLAADPKLRTGVENGLTLGKDRRAISAFQDGQVAGNSAIISKIPGLKQAQTGLDHFLFEKYVPSLKVRGYNRLYDAYAKAYPDWTPTKVAQVAAADTNERFGGLAYKQMGRSAATQNWAKLVALAPDWLESEVRAISRNFGSEGKVMRGDMLKSVAALWGTARVLNYLISGKAHNEAPFGVAMTGDDGKEKIYSMRSLPTDMLHAVSDPVGFVHGRFSPLAKVGAEVVTGRDAQGKKLDRSGIAMDLFSQLSPIPVQSAVKGLSGQAPDTSTPDQLVKAGGFTVMPYKTEAQKLAAKIASDHSEQGRVDPEVLQKHQLLQHFEDEMRSGKITPSDISQLVLSGQLPQADAKRMMTNFQRTRDLSPELASFYTRASRLPTKDLLDVYEASTAGERQAIAPLVQKSGANYVKNSMTKFTPQERQSDPTLKRVMALMPSTPPF